MRVFLLKNAVHDGDLHGFVSCNMKYSKHYVLNWRYALFSVWKIMHRNYLFQSVLIIILIAVKQHSKQIKQPHAFWKFIRQHKFTNYIKIFIPTDVPSLWTWQQPVTTAYYQADIRGVGWPTVALLSMICRTRGTYIHFAYYVSWNASFLIWSKSLSYHFI